MARLLIARLAALIVIPTFIGCSSTPDASLTYYLAETDLEVQVLRTVTCDTHDHLIVANAATLTPGHSADLREPKYIEIAALDGFLSNSEIGFGFFEDGRLQSVNATSTGQGETFLKAAVGLATTVGILGTTPTYPDECAFINADEARKARGEKTVRDKVLTLKFQTTIEPTCLDDPAELRTKQACSNPVEIPIAPEHEPLLPHLWQALGLVTAETKGVTRPNPPVIHNTASPSEIELALRQPAFLRVEIRAGVGGSLHKNGALVQDVTVSVAHLGVPYEVPIPKAAIFGKQVFALTLDASGALKSIGYDKQTGIGQVLGVSAELAKALKDPTTAEEAAAVKAEADLIFQQQRLVRCQANKEECT